MNQQMRGLSVFISDIRNAQNRDQEKKRVDKEMANIRKHFASEKTLTPYQKKKYVWKLLYIYMLGYDVDFGHMEALNLISGPKYSDKSVGYMACSLLLNESHEFLRLVINSIRNDLISTNMDAVVLALCTVANIGGKDFAEALGGDVERLILADDLPVADKNELVNVRKKACLCLLRLYRKNPDIIQAEKWAEKIGPLLEDRHLGLLTSAMSLLMGLASQELEPFEMNVGRVIRILIRIVLNKEYTVDYTYYLIPSPWLQVKCLRFLQYYPPPSDASLRLRLTEALQRIITQTEQSKNVNKNNAAHAILFEAINLVVHMDADRQLLRQAISMLGKFVSVREPNIRYLALETMARLTVIPDTLETIKRHQQDIVRSLSDEDISIRRRGLDLMYEMCDKSNAKAVVQELLNYLVKADFQIREELVLKIAILAERFATEYSWYVDTILQLIQLAGDFVSDEVAYRIIQIVTNHEDLQQYTARNVFDALREDPAHVHERLLQVGGYILGEFGHHIADDSGCSPAEQFGILKKLFGPSSNASKAILLTTFAKFMNLYPELQKEICDVVGHFRSSFDPELQQRAVEYFSMANVNKDILAAVWDIMPNFPERESILLRRIREQTEDTTDRSVTAIKKEARDRSESVSLGGTDDEDVKDKQRERRARLQSVHSNAASDEGSHGTPTSSRVNHPAQTGGLLDTDDNSAPLPATAPPPSQPVSVLDDLLATDIGSMSVGDAEETPSYRELCLKQSGLLMEDGLLQVGLKSEYRGAHGRVHIFLGNKSDHALSNVHLSVTTPPGLAAAQVPSPGGLAPKEQKPVVIDFTCVQPFNGAPVLKISYDTHARNVKLPILLTKFLEHVPLTSQDFFHRWNNVKGEPLEVQHVFKSMRPIDTTTMKEVIRTGLNFGILDGVDPNPTNAVSAAKLTLQNGLVPCLLRIEANVQAQMYRMTVKTASGPASQLLGSIIQDTLSR